MSNLQLNRRKPIRLPFSTAPKAPARLNQVEQTDCGICGERKSKYVCPRCNVFYCSLGCFRSNNHVQCSEPFYAATIKQQITQLPSRTPEEKKAMLQILDRFERGGSSGQDGGQPGTGEEEVKGNGVGAESLESLYRSLVSETGRGFGRATQVGSEERFAEVGEQEGFEDEEDDPEAEAALQDLASRLDGVDLESMAPQDLFALLPARHRKRFISLLEKEGSRDRLIKDAQDEEDSDDDQDYQSTAQVWWMPSGMALESPEDEGVSDEDSSDEDGVGMRDESPVRPEALDAELVKGITVPASSVEGLKFNLVAICMAYIILIRSIRLPQGIIQAQTSSPPSRLTSTIQSLKNLLSTLVPFLFDPKSTWKAKGLREVEEEVFGGVEDVEMRLAVLEDLLHVVHPPLTVSDSHPVLLAISDLAALFASHTHPTAKEKAIRKKLEFYYVLAGSVRRVDWVALEGLVQSRLEALRGDDDEEEEDDEPVQHKQMENPLMLQADVPTPVRSGVSAGPKIEEL